MNNYVKVSVYGKVSEDLPYDTRCGNTVYSLVFFDDCDDLSKSLAKDRVRELCSVYAGPFRRVHVSIWRHCTGLDYRVIGVARSHVRRTLAESPRKDG